MTRTKLAVITIDDDLDLVVSLDQIGRVDLREWSRTGDYKYPTKNGCAIPRSSVTALIDALRKAKRRAVA